MNSGFAFALRLLLVLCAGLGSAGVLPALAQNAGPASVAQLAKTLSPAVVNIGTSRHFGGASGEPFPEVPEGSPLEDLFDDLNPNEGLGPQAEQEARSLGSGFLISAEGLVVTNNHVIDGAEEIQVFLSDGTRLPASIVGADDKTDLAVLKVDAGRPLPFVEFGDSEAAEVGDWVMAIGNPFGLGGSVTLGIVSARNRDISAGPYDNFIQTDASINQGNSGGPLFTMDGKVVGINTAIISQAGSSLGIGFAVPVNLARPVIEQLAEFGETRRGWLGVGIQDVTEDIASTLDRTDTHGALVINVTPDGPATGILEEGDLILTFDGKPVNRMRDLPRIVAETEVGKAVSVEVLRRGEEKEFAITLGRLEAGEQMIAEAEQSAAPEPEAVTIPDGPAPTLSDMVGIEVMPIDPKKREEFALPEEMEGLVVTDVAAGSDAYAKGFMTGIVVTEVNQKPIKTVADVTRLVGAAKEAGRPAVLFKVMDQTGSSRFVAVKLN